MAKPDPDDAPIGVCEMCGKPCHAVWSDEGFGPYEFWGARGEQHDWRWVSPCCHVEVVQPPEEEDR